MFSALSQILVIDVGNSRLKWALRGSRGWTARGAVANQDIGPLAVRDWQNLERPLRAVGVHVAGEAARARVGGPLARWQLGRALGREWGWMVSGRASLL